MLRIFFCDFAMKQSEKIPDETYVMNMTPVFSKIVQKVHVNHNCPCNHKLVESNIVRQKFLHSKSCDVGESEQVHQ